MLRDGTRMQMLMSFNIQSPKEDVSQTPANTKLLLIETEYVQYWGAVL